MIIGRLDQIWVCDLLSQIPALGVALEWIRTHQHDAVDGVTDLGHPDFYVHVHGYQTRPRESCPWESHRHTADLQCGLSGGECVDWTPATGVLAAGLYDEHKDVDTWPVDLPSAETITLNQGRFAIFLPGELHRPAVANGRDPSVRKLVVKIPARLLCRS